MMRFFKKKRARTYEDPAESRFDSMMDLIKDLPRADYNRLKDAMDLGYNAYQKVRNVKTADEKEVNDIEEAERKLVNEENK